MIVPDSIKKLPDNYVPFQATTTRGNYTSTFAMWKVREVVLAAIALFTIVVASGALDNAFAPMNLNALPIDAWKCILAVSVYLGFRTLVFRTFLAHITHHAIYPLKGWNKPGFCPIWPGNHETDDGHWRRKDYNYFRAQMDKKHVFDDSTYTALDIWDSNHNLEIVKNGYPHEVITIKTIEGMGVHTRFLLPKDRQCRSVIILSCGRTSLYSTQYVPQTLEQEFLAKNIAVMLYHPPGYGQTPGPRTPQKYFLALEAIIQYLLVEKKIPEDRIELSGFSIGCGATLEMATKYRLKSVCVSGSFAKMSTAAALFSRNDWKHKQCSIFGKVMGFVTCFFLDGVIDDYYGYDNCTAMKNTLIKRVVISQGREDEYACDLFQEDLSKRKKRSEGEALQKAWLERFPGAKKNQKSDELTVFEMGEHSLHFRNHGGGHEFNYSKDIWPENFSN